VAGIVGDPLLQMVMVVNIGRAGALTRPSRRYRFAALELALELNVTSNFASDASTPG
jgi:hypothetical protein